MAADRQTIVDLIHFSHLHMKLSGRIWVRFGSVSLRPAPLKSHFCGSGQRILATRIMKLPSLKS